MLSTKRDGKQGGERFPIPTEGECVFRKNGTVVSLNRGQWLH